AARRESAMREIAMIAGSDREDAQPIEPDRGRDRSPGDTGPDGGEADEMDDDEGNGGRIDDVVMLAGGRRSVFCRGQFFAFHEDARVQEIIAAKTARPPGRV